MDIRKMENVSYNRFTINGEEWQLSKYPKNMGTSAKGIWNLFTNGEEHIRIYKADVKKVLGTATATKLFHNN